jgi:hypothetical protein
MAIATATAISLGIAAAGSGYQMIQGANAKAQANQAASNAANQLAQLAEADRFKSLQVPTLGLELAQQNIQARQAQQLQGLQDIGAAGVLGGTTALNVQGQREDLALAAQGQQAQYERDIAQAENAQRIEANRIARQSGLAQSRLQGAQLAASQGQAEQNAGLAGLASTAGQFAVESFKNQPLYDQTKVGDNGALTPNQTVANAQNAFAPQIAKMAQPLAQVQQMNPGLTQMQANVRQANYTPGVLAPPPQQNWWQQPNSPYQFMFGNLNNTGQ